jgi:hypothetical protein
MADIEQSQKAPKVPRYIQLALYGLLCLALALAIFFLQIENRFVLIFLFGLLFLIAMLFDRRGVMHSVPTGPYCIKALAIYLGALGLLAVLLFGDYFLAFFGTSGFFERMDAVLRLAVFTSHLPLVLLACLLGGVALFGHWIAVRRRDFPRFVSQMMDRSFLLFVALGLIVPLTSLDDGLHAVLAPLLTGDPDVLDRQMIYENFTLLDAQLNRVHGYALQAQREAAEATTASETLCIPLPGPYWSSERLQAQGFPPDMLGLVDEPALLLESRQAALDGVTRYERLGEAMLREPSGFEMRTAFAGEGYLICSRNAVWIADEIESSLERLEEARHILDEWIEANRRLPASQAAYASFPTI